MKINPFDYLFYKLTVFLDHLDENYPEGASPFIMGMIFTINIWTILNIFIGRFNPYWLIYVFSIPFFVTMAVYLPTKRWKNIEEKYEDESDKQRIRGNWLVFLYVVATVGLFIWSFRFVPVNR